MSRGRKGETWTTKRLNELLAAIPQKRHKVPPRTRIKVDADGMNGLERKFRDDYIMPRVRTGEILTWSFEMFTIKLAHNLHYTPDFRIKNAAGVVAFYETKGFLREDAWIKMKICEKLVDESLYLCKWSKAGGWSIAPVHQSEPLDGEDVA